MLNRGMVTAVAIPMTPVAALVTAPMFPAGTSKRAFAPLATDAGAPMKHVSQVKQEIFEDI